MDSVRLNSSVSGVFPYYAPYQSSDLSAECLPGQGETPNDSASGRICQAGASGDSVSISPQARRMYDASASSADLAAAAPVMVTLLNMPAENIALYNQLRRERDTLPPGDPRVIEITGKLRAVLMAGDDPLPLEDRHHVRHAETAAETSPKADQDTGRGAEQSAKQADAVRGAAPSASDSSKSRHDRREARAAAQQAESSDAARPVTVGTSGASDTTEGVPLFSHASASFSPIRLYGVSGAGTFDHHSLGMSASGRLYRVA